MPSWNAASPTSRSSDPTPATDPSHCPHERSDRAGPRALLCRQRALRGRSAGRGAPSRQSFGSLSDGVAASQTGVSRVMRSECQSKAMPYSFCCRAAGTLYSGILVQSRGLEGLVAYRKLRKPASLPRKRYQRLQQPRPRRPQTALERPDDVHRRAPWPASSPSA